MHTGIIHQLSGLERDVQRLERLLAPDPAWQAFQALGPGATVADLPEDARATLAGNRLFQARAKLTESIGLLRELVTDAAAPAESPPLPTPSETLATEAKDRGPHQPAAADIAPPPPAVDPELSSDASESAFRTKIKVKPARDDDHVAVIQPVAQIELPTEIPTATATATDTATELQADAAAPPAAPVRKSWSAAPALNTALVRRPGLGGLLRAGLSARRALAEAQASATEEPATAIEAAAPAVLPTLPLVAEAPPPAERAQRLPHIPKAANDDVPGRLEQIRGLTHEHLSRLAENSVLHCADVARWTSDDVARFSVLLGPSAPISRDQWIEQASILATGGETAYARRRAEGDFACLVAAPALAGPWECRLLPEAQAAPVVSEIPEIAPRERENTVEQPAALAPPTETDNEDRHILAQVDKAQATLNERIANLERTIAAIRNVGATRLAKKDLPATEAAATSESPADRAPAPCSVGAFVEKPENSVEPPAAAPGQAAKAPAIVPPASAFPLEVSEAAFALTGGEADVEIVIVKRPEVIAPHPAPAHAEPLPAAASPALSQAPKAGGAVPQPITRSPASEPAPSQSLARRLGHHLDDDEQASPREYAAYQGFVEEASVQIVRHSRPDSGDAIEARPKAAGEAQPEAAKPSRGLGFGRYLKALTGE